MEDRETPMVHHLLLRRPVSPGLRGRMRLLPLPNTAGRFAMLLTGQVACTLKPLRISARRIYTPPVLVGVDGERWSDSDGHVSSRQASGSEASKGNTTFVGAFIAESTVASASRVPTAWLATDRGEVIFPGHPREVVQNEEVRRTIRG
jgi:hypothetical protein